MLKDNNSNCLRVEPDISNKQQFMYSIPIKFDQKVNIESIICEY